MRTRKRVASGASPAVSQFQRRAKPSRAGCAVPGRTNEGLWRSTTFTAYRETFRSYVQSLADAMRKDLD
jgi:hypothetical protein